MVISKLVNWIPLWLFQVLHKKLKKTTDSEKKAKLKQLIDRMVRIRQN